MEKLERKLWFGVLVSVLATFTTLYLMESAGLPRMAEMNMSQVAVYALCFGACWKLFSSAVWLLVLFLRRPAVQR